MALDRAAGTGREATFFRAMIETDHGNMEITLRPDLAPNHVRNFIALARLGYYDGLVFERTVHGRPLDHPEIEVDIVEAGCPLGTGEVGVGSLGYWLKPEFSAEPHDIGTIGAPHGEEWGTAGCRFYVSLKPGRPSWTATSRYSAK